jgi:hypothetical protein
MAGLQTDQAENAVTVFFHEIAFQLVTFDAIFRSRGGGWMTTSRELGTEA